MSILIIMAPPEKTDWRIEPKVVADSMKEKWPAAKLGWSKDPKDSVAFDFAWDTEDYHVVGSFNRDGQCLFLSHASDEDIAAMAVWYRGLVPPSETLVAWSGSGENCALTPGMTAADFLRDFHY